MSKVRKRLDASHMRLTLAQEKCLVKHAREIFTKIVQVGHGLTDQNVQGISAAAESSIEVAELFQRKLEEKGYGIRTEHAPRIEINTFSGSAGGANGSEQEPAHTGGTAVSQSVGYPAVLGDAVRAGLGECRAPGTSPVRKEDEQD